MDRNKKLKVIFFRLIIIVGLSLAAIGGLFLWVFLVQGGKFMISWFGIVCGIIGGFVSIEQRLKKAKDEELDLLSSSWPSLIVSPLFGGIFALLLYIIFLAKIVTSDLFPTYYTPAFASIPSAEDLKNLFENTYPMTSMDFAKHSFWCFVAGFSERFVVSIIYKTAGVEDESAKPAT